MTSPCHVITLQPWADTSSILTFLHRRLGLETQVKNDRTIIVSGMTRELFEDFCTFYAPPDDNPDLTPIADFDIYKSPPLLTKRALQIFKELLNGSALSPRHLREKD